MLITLIAIFLILFGGLRATGFDYDLYKNIYKHITIANRNDYLAEFGFAVLASFFKLLSFPYNGFLFALTSICVIIKFPVIKRFSPYPLLSLLLYFSISFIMSDMGQIRNSIALAIVMWGYSDLFKNNERRFIMKVIVACVFHNSAFIILPIYWIIKNISKISPWIIYTSIAFLLPLLFLDIRDVFMRFNDYLPDVFAYKVVAYTESDVYGQRVGFGMTFLLRVGVLFGLFFFRKKGEARYSYYPLLVNLYLAGVIVFILFNSVEQFAVRFTNYFKMLEYIILPMFIVLSKHKGVKFILYLFVCAYAGWSLYKLLTEPELAVQLLPYKSILFNSLH
jgi:EpsG family